MKYVKLKEWYEKNNMKEEFVEVRKKLDDFNEYLIKNEYTLETCTDELIQSYLEVLRTDKQLDKRLLYGFARYFKLNGFNDRFIYFTKLFGGEGVIESMHRKCRTLTDESTADFLFKEHFPELAIKPKNMVKYATGVLASLKVLEPDLRKEILTGNHHQIPREAMLKEKQLYEESDSLESYLKERHDRKVEELQMYCDENKVWYEQVITPKVIDFVKSNQEVLSAVKEDNYLYVTKIPYDTVAFIEADNEQMKRYHYCHCPFVKESIMDDVIIEKEWCNCSAGFAKFPFEVILDRPLKVTVLESVLVGDLRCRFRIEME